MRRYCTRCSQIVNHKHQCKKKVAQKNMSAQETKENKFYRSYQWKQLRNQKKNDIGYQCEICRYLGKIGYSDNIHHVKTIREYWVNRLEYENLLGVCIEHHRDIEKNKLETKKEIFQFYKKQMKD